MQQHQQVEEYRPAHRRPAGWPGIAVATRRASTRRRGPGALREHPAWDPRRTSARVAPDAGIQISVLDRMVGLLTLLVEEQERGAYDADDLELVALMTADLDRHLTTLTETRYEADDDARVLAIEEALVRVRTRLHERSTGR